MRKSRFTESQIVEILKQGETGVPIAEILRQHNISRGHIVSVAGEVRGRLGDRAQAAEGARGGECLAEAGVRRARAGKCSDQGRPERKR